MSDTYTEVKSDYFQTYQELADDEGTAACGIVTIDGYLPDGTGRTIAEVILCKNGAFRICWHDNGMRADLRALQHVYGAKKQLREYYFTQYAAPGFTEVLQVNLGNTAIRTVSFTCMDARLKDRIVEISIDESVLRALMKDAENNTIAIDECCITDVIPDIHLKDPRTGHLFILQFTQER